MTKAGTRCRFLWCMSVAQVGQPLPVSSHLFTCHIMCARVDSQHDLNPAGPYLWQKHVWPSPLWKHFSTVLVSLRISFQKPQNLAQDGIKGKVNTEHVNIFYCLPTVTSHSCCCCCSRLAKLPFCGEWVNSISQCVKICVYLKMETSLLLRHALRGQIYPCKYDELFFFE